MKLPWRRRKRAAWPKEVERRLPENAERREREELIRRNVVATKLEMAAALTNETDRRIQSVRAAVRVMTSREEKG